jgi:hypothetical protein
MNHTETIDDNAHNLVALEDRGPGMDSPRHYTYATPAERPVSRDVRVVDAVKSRDRELVSRLVREGCSVHQRAEQDWTPLCFAAGLGDQDMVALLVELGADVAVTGRDRRRPTAIARAAGHTAVAAFLAQRERERGLPEEPKRYCKAYYLRELRGYPAWSEGHGNWVIGNYWSSDLRAHFEKSLGDEDVVFLHQDLTVTASIWHGEHVLFDRVDDAWREYCTRALGFSIPEDLR